MSNRSATYTLYLNSNVKQALIDTEQSALRLDSTIAGLQTTLAGIGIGLGLREIFNETKEWVEQFAEIERYTLRIKNNSITGYEGANNVKFINDEVDKLRINLIGTTDAWGDFLVKIRNSGMAASEIRKLHDEVLTISKVTAASPHKMDAAVRDIGIMLGEGVLEGRHMRALSYVFPQIIPYIAKELGVDTQHFSKLIGEGKLTKSSIDSKILLKAIEEYSTELKSKLPETLNTMESHLNQTETAWTRFKNETIEQYKPALIELFSTVRDGVHWMDVHREGIERTVKVLILAAEAYGIYRIGMFALNGLQLIRNTTSGISIAQTISSTGAIRGETAAITQLVEALQLLVASQTEAAETGLFLTETQAAGILSSQAYANQLANLGLSVSSGAAMGAGSMAANASRGFGSSVMGAISSGVMVVGVAWMAASVMEALGAFGQTAGGRDRSAWDMAGLSKWGKSDEGILSLLGQGDYNAGAKIAQGWQGKDPRHVAIREALNSYPSNFNYRFGKEGDLIPFGEAYSSDEKKSKSAYNKDGVFMGSTGFGWDSDAKGTGFPAEKTKNEFDGSDIIKKLAGSHGIKGNSVTNIHVEIKEMNGVKTATFSLKGNSDADDAANKVGEAMVKHLTAAVNDSQIVAGHH